MNPQIRARSARTASPLQAGLPAPRQGRCAPTCQRPPPGSLGSGGPRPLPETAPPQQGCPRPKSSFGGCAARTRSWRRQSKSSRLQSLSSRRPVESAQYTAIRFGETLFLQGLQPSIGSIGDACTTTCWQRPRSTPAGWCIVTRCRPTGRTQVTAVCINPGRFHQPNDSHDQFDHRLPGHDGWIKRR